MAIKNQWEVADQRIQERIEAALEEQYRADLDEIALMESQIKEAEELMKGKENHEIMNAQIDRQLAKLKAKLDSPSTGDNDEEVEEFEMIHSSGLSRAAQEILKDEVLYIDGLTEQELKDAETKSMMQMLAMTCDYHDRQCIGWIVENGKIIVNQINALKAESAVDHRVESIRRQDHMLYDGPLATATMLEILLNHAANNRELLFKKSDDTMLDATYAEWREELRRDPVLRKAVLLHTESMKRLNKCISDRINESFTGDPAVKPDPETMRTMAMIAGVYRMDRDPEAIFKIVDGESRIETWRPEHESTHGEGEVK